MTIRKVVTLFVAVALLVSPVARAGIGDEAAGGAVASLGILLGTEAYKALSTRSAISVVVEQYQDTRPIAELAGENLPVEKRRTVPFTLGKPAALAKLREGTGQEFSLVTAVRIRNAAAPYMEMIQKANVAAASNPIPKAAGFMEASEEVDYLGKLSTEILEAWKAYAGTVDGMVGDGVALETELDRAKSQLEALREQLKRVEKYKLSDALVEYLMTIVFTIDPEFIGSAEVQELFGEARVDLRKLPSMPEQVARIGELLSAIPEAFKDVAAAMRKAMPQLGIPGDSSGSPNADQKQLADILSLSVAGPAALTVTYVNVGTSMNFGPIRNEVTQVLLSGNAQLDEVLEHADDKSRWRLMNYVKSKGGLGNHTAVVYLDNTATPVLKEATFDPSGFIEAYGLAYETAMDSAFGLFALPEALPTGGDTNNLYRLDQSVNKARAATRAYVNQLAAAATKLKGFHTDLGAANLTPADAKTQMTGLATSLAGSSN